MKQRLLYAILMLFGVFSMAKAENTLSLTIPKGEGKVTITVTGDAFALERHLVIEGKVDGDVEYDAYSNSTTQIITLVQNADNDRTVPLTVGSNIVTALNINGKVSVFDASGITSGSNISTKLTSLVFSNNGELKNLALKSSSTCVFPNLVTLDCRNNKLSAIPGKNNFSSQMTSAGYLIGTQSPEGLSSINASGTTVSNKALDLTMNQIKVGNTKLFYMENEYVSYSNWRKKQADNSFANASSIAHADEMSPYRYYFYEVKNGKKCYSGDADFFCDATIGSGSQYYPGVTIKNVPVHVAAATFSFTTTVEPAAGGTVTVKNGNRDAGATVKVGDQLVVTIAPNPLYEVKAVEPIGLTKSDVADTYSVDGSGDVELKVYFIGKAQTISYTSQVSGGTVAVKSVDPDQTIAPNGTAPYGSKIQIFPSPLQGYEVEKVTVNGETLSADENQHYITTVKEGNNIINCSFKQVSSTYKITFDRSSYPNLDFSGTNGVIADAGNTQTNYSYSAQKDTKVEFKFVYNPSDNKRITKVLLDGVPMSLQEFKPEAGTYKQAFMATATMPDHDVVMTLETTTLNQIAVSVSDNQSVTYTGAAQTAAYSAVPNLTDLTAWYSTDGGTSWKEGSPVNAATYKVKFTRDEDKVSLTGESGKLYYLAYETEPVTFNIAKADPKIETLPVFEVKKNTEDGKYYYKLKTNGKATFNGQTLTGEFTVDATNALVPDGSESKSHTTAVTFTVKNKDGGDDTNFKKVMLTANVTVPNSTLKQYTVKIGKLGDATMKLYNGTMLVAQGEGSSVKVAEGTILKAELSKPGYQTSHLSVISVDDEGNENENAVPTYPTSVDKTTICVDKDLKLGVKTDGDKYVYTAELVLKSSDVVCNYNGNPHVLAIGDLSFASKPYDTGVEGVSYTLSTKEASFQAGFSVKYIEEGKEIPQPINAGTYTAVITYDPAKASSSYRFEPFEGSLTITIKKVAAPVSKTKGANDLIQGITASPIAKGQPLSQSQLTGSTDIEGHYEWVDETHVPSSIDATKAASTSYKYQVKFVPKDSRNYDSVILDGYVAVEVSDKAIITFAPKNGTIKVVDSKNKEYVSGEEVTKDTQLTITATPDYGYAFESMTIDGKKTTNKVATFKMGEQSVAIEAVFSEYVNREVVAFSATAGGTISVVGTTNNHVYRNNEIVDINTQLTVTATPNTGFKLKSLTINGRVYTTSPQVIQFTGTTTISAVFEKENPESVILTFPTESEVSGKGFTLNVYGAQSYDFGKEITLVVSTLVEDAKNIVVKAGSTTVAANKDGSYTIKADAEKSISVSLSKTPTPLKVAIEMVTKNAKGYVMGHVEIIPASSLRAATPTYYYGDKVTLIAYPESGVTFAYWSDDRTNKSNVRTITLTKDIDIKPVFKGVPTDVESIESAEVIGGDDCIIIRGVADARVTIVSMDGRSQQQMVNGDTRINVRAGVYGVILEQGKAVIREKIVVR